MTDRYDAIILGAGAAGLMCAAIAGQRGRRVLVVEKAEQSGKKILISGGGRCNFTNIHTAPDRYLSANPHFARSALSRYTPQDFLGLVEHEVHMYIISLENAPDFSPAFERYNNGLTVQHLIQNIQRPFGHNNTLLPSLWSNICVRADHLNIP